MSASGLYKDIITAENLRKGDFQVLARCISAIENAKPGSEELLKSLRYKPIPLIGITGPPGAGKSTITDALIKEFTDQGKKIAVLCIDPSSSFHSGAILGDRIRMDRWFNNPLVYIRSLASRGDFGGLSPRIFQITDLFAEAGFDLIMIETVGVGQTEVDINYLADQVILVLVPEAGDEIQTMKSGIMEIGHIFVVNKADRPGADQFLQSLKSSLHYQSAKPANEIQFILTTATEGKGITELYTAITDHLNQISPKRSLDLLARKSWELITANKMRHLTKEGLKKSLETAMQHPDFNLYQFADAIAKEK